MALRDLEFRDLGQWFGANNPRIEHPPDYNACMQRILYDEENLLLLCSVADTVMLIVWLHFICYIKLALLHPNSLSSAWRGSACPCYARG